MIPAKCFNKYTQHLLEIFIKILFLIRELTGNSVVL